MIWILLWISGTTATFAGEYNTQAACESAKAQILVIKKEGGANMLPTAALCTQKGIAQ